MFLKNYQHLKNNKLSTGVFLFLISFFIRIPIIIIFIKEITSAANNNLKIGGYFMAIYIVRPG